MTELIAKTTLPILLLLIGLLFYSWIFNVMLNDWRLTKYLKKQKPLRWNQIMSSFDEFTISTEFVPGFYKAKRHFRYLFSIDDCEIPEVFTFKKKIQSGFKLTIVAIIGIFLELVIVYIFLVRK